MNKTFLTKGLGLLAALLLVPKVGGAQWYGGGIPSTASHRIYYNIDSEGNAYAAGVAEGYWTKIKHAGEEEKDTFINYKPLHATSLSVKSTVTDPETGKSYKVTGISGFGTEYELNSISLPSTITHIYGGAFNGCYMLRSINLHEGITFIGQKAFGSTNIHSITLPSTLEKVESGIFYDCYTLESVTVLGNIMDGCLVGPATESITFGPKVWYIGDNVAKGCAKLTSIDIQGRDVSIGDFAFEGCTALTSLNLSNVAVINARAFFGCTGIKSVTIPQSVKDIYGGAFAGMTLNKFTIDSDLIMSGEESTVSSSSSFLNIFTDTYGENKTEIELLEISDNIKEIGKYKFRGCDNFKKVKLGKNIQSIGDFAFQKAAITEVDLPEKLDSIGEYAFASCQGLESVSLPRGLRVIGSHAFQNSAIKSLYYDNVSYKRDSTALFNSQRSIIYPSGNYLLPGFKLETIGNEAFDNCNLEMKDTEFMVFPSSVKTIGRSAFYANKNITNVVMPENLEHYSGGAFTRQIGDSWESYEMVPYRSVVFLGTKLWDKRDFYNWPEHIFSDEVPRVTFAGEHVDSIPARAFRTNSYIESCTIEPDVYQAVKQRNGGEWKFPICEYAFYKCSKFSKLAIYGPVSTLEPDKYLEVSPTSIEEGAFKSCSSLTEFTLGEDLEKIGYDAFSITNNLELLNVNSAKLLKWMQEPLGDGEYLRCFSNWFSSMTEVRLGEEITEIPAWCFGRCGGLKKLSVSNYITKIGEYAFVDCWNLEELPPLHPVLCDTIPEGAFSSCQLIRTFNIPKCVKYIGNTAFSNCGFESVRIPYYVDYIGYGAFAHCHNLKYFTIPNPTQRKASEDTWTWSRTFDDMDETWKEQHQHMSYRMMQSSTPVFMGLTVFADCDALQDVKIYRPMLATKPGDDDQLYQTSVRQFNECALRRIHLPHSLEGINFASFESCPNLKFIDLRGDLPYGIADMAFADCSSLHSVRIPPYQKRGYLGEYAFSGCKVLHDVVVQWTKDIPRLYRNTFDPETAEDGGGTLWVPWHTTDLYKASEWGIFKNIKEYIGCKFRGDGSIATFVEQTDPDGTVKLVVDYGERLETPGGPGEFPLEGSVTYTMKSNEEGWIGVYVPSEVNVAILEEMGFKVYKIDDKQSQKGTLKVTEVSNDAAIKAHEAIMMRVKDQKLWNQTVQFTAKNYNGLYQSMQKYTIGNVMNLMMPCKNLTKSEANDKYTIKKMRMKNANNNANPAPRRAPEYDEAEEGEDDIAVSPYEFYVDVPFEEGEERPEYIEIEIAGDDPSGISEVVKYDPRSTSERIYNLSGQRVSDSYKGVVIKNGKRYIKK